jgi:hypothetical protein
MTGGGKMAQHKEPIDLSDSATLDTARIGYQVATSLWIYEGGLIWSKFNALLVANSIILAAIVLALTTSNGIPRLAGLFSTAMPPIGIVLCWLWLSITRRSFAFHSHWIDSAREIEKRFPGQVVTTVADGRDLAKHSRFRGLPRVETSSYLIIGLFAVFYVILFVVGVGLLNASR